MKKITKRQLEKLYKKYPNKVVADKLKISVPTLIRYVIKLGIKQKGRGNRESTGVKLIID